MTEGAKNTILGVTLTALLGIGFASVSQSFDNGKHLTKIDAVLEQQKDILGELKKSANTIPAPVETKLEELRWRLNSIEGRVNHLDATPPQGNQQKP